MEVALLDLLRTLGFRTPSGVEVDKVLGCLSLDDIVSTYLKIFVIAYDQAGVSS